MDKPYRLGVVGFAHMHVNSLIRGFAESPNVQWVACADTAPDVPELVEIRDSRSWNLRNAQGETGIPKVYDDYRQMLEREQFDLVIFCPENAKHAEVAEAIAANGAHMLTEKPMAASLADALRMRRAARAAGVDLFVNWPITWSPAIRKAKELIDVGAIGSLFEVKWRGGSLGPMSHGSTRVGPDGQVIEMTDIEKGALWWYRSGTGGGALLDYCSYGACLARWYIGEGAVAVQGIAANLGSPYGGVEDNAVITVRFPKALAILEATWNCVDHGIPTGPVLYGSEGTLVVDREFGKPGGVYVHRGHGRPPEYVAGDPLPVGRETLAREVFTHLETGQPVHLTLDADFNLEAMAILDSGIRSVKSGKQELVDDARWRVG